MPDRWGRPTFEDGLNIYKGLEMVRADRRLAEDRKTDQEAFAVADLLSQKGDVSEYTPEARQKGSRLYWDNRLKELQVQTQENLKTESVRREKLSGLKLNLEIAQQRLKSYKMARSMGDDKRAKEIAMQLSNENMYNGRFIEKSDDGYTSTQWDGSKEKFKDIPIDQVDQLIGQYFDKPYDELMKWQLSAEQQRQKRNFETLQKSEPMYDENGNPVGFKIPAGIWAPDGRPRGQHYVDLTGEREVPKKEATKWRTSDQLGVKMSVYKTKTERMKAETAQKKEGGEKVPGHVKEAQDFILKFANTDVEPGLAMMMMTNPTALSDPAFKQRISGGVPPEYQATFDSALQIVQQYYAGKAPEAPEGMAQPELDETDKANRMGRDMGASKVLDRETAMEYLQRAGGDKDKARQMAKNDGYQF